MACWILHVDLDQFIAAVEVLRRPELRGLPVVVGGDGDPTKRGVVATASYQARDRGVHSGLPLRTAARRCPDAVFLRVDRPAYETASAQVMAVLRELDAVVEVVGWDEAFLAVETDQPEEVARQVAQRVRTATRLDCSVGIGQNKLQAKLATGFAKPAGVFRLTHGNWLDVLGGRPVDALWGIGSRTARRLAALGIGTVDELAAARPARAGRADGPGNRPVAGPDGPRPGSVEGDRRPLPGPLPQPGGHLPAGHRRLGAGSRGDLPHRRAGRGRRPGGTAPGGPGGLMASRWPRRPANRRRSRMPRSPRSASSPAVGRSGCSECGPNSATDRPA